MGAGGGAAQPPDKRAERVPGAREAGRTAPEALPPRGEHIPSLRGRQIC